jgi:hypothetical protein
MFARTGLEFKMGIPARFWCMVVAEAAVGCEMRNGMVGNELAGDEMVGDEMLGSERPA